MLPLAIVLGTATAVCAHRVIRATLLPSTAAVALLLSLPFPTLAQDSIAPSPFELARARYERLDAEFIGAYRRAATSGGSAVSCQLTISRICLDDHYWPQWYTNSQRYKLDSLRLDLANAIRHMMVFVPGDKFLNGERVRHLVDAKQFLIALATNVCDAESWWCLALNGFTYASAGDYRAADILFEEAFSAMPDSTACRWRDISLLLDADSREAYEALDCAARGEFEERFWWLSDPLLSTSWNERRAEHFSRQVRNDIMIGRPFPTESYLWEKPMLSANLRFGFPDHFILGDRHLHFVQPQQQFTPSFNVYTDSLRFTDEPWSLSQWNEDSRERMQIPGKNIRQLHNQRAAFRRGDSALHVVAADLSQDPGLQKTSAATIVLSTGPNASASRTDAISEGATYVAAAYTSIRQEQLLSLEITGCAGTYGWARGAVRDAFQSKDRLALSDPLLFRPLDQTPKTLEDAQKVMLPRMRFERGVGVGVFWEVYGADERDTLTVTLEAIPAPRGRSIFNRIAVFVGLASLRGPSSVQWTENGSWPGVRSGAVVLRTSDLRPDSYTLAIHVSSSTGDTASTTRQIEILERYDPRAYDPPGFRTARASASSQRVMLALPRQLGGGRVPSEDPC